MRIGRVSKYRAFQFPTGWNSTIADEYRYLLKEQFQFPTGWNSTIETQSGIFDRAGFNSQRDGILQRSNKENSMAHNVSIPNGMEFYALCKPPQSYRYPVSIPNGMEFYPNFNLLFFHQNGFQFPTRWNSTQRRRLEIWDRRVSIPNGMEFYAG